VNPQNKSGHIVYTCKGVDEEGNWEGERRFNEFYKLNEKLADFWPGIPLPSMPPKKAIGNKDLQFINERRFYLERYLKKMSAFKFVIDSPEFRAFSRPQGDIEKSLNNIKK
jgi:sorting nexin-1/2